MPDGDQISHHPPNHLQGNVESRHITKMKFAMFRYTYISTQTNQPTNQQHGGYWCLQSPFADTKLAHSLENSNKTIVFTNLTWCDMVHFCIHWLTYNHGYLSRLQKLATIKGINIHIYRFVCVSESKPSKSNILA